MALAYPVSPNPLSNGELGGHQRAEQVRRRHTDPGETFIYNVVVWIDVIDVSVGHGVMVLQLLANQLALLL